MGMREKFREHFLKIGPRRFVNFAVIVLVILDLLNTWYLKLYWMSKNYSLVLVYQSIRQMGYPVEDFSRETILEMQGFLDNTFYFLVFIILINNLFFYFFYYKKRLWAQGYVLFYTITGAILAVSFIVDNGGLGAWWMLYNVLTIFVYGYLFAGVKLLKDETTIPPSPGRGKKAR